MPATQRFLTRVSQMKHNRVPQGWAAKTRKAQSSGRFLKHARRFLVILDTRFTEKCVITCSVDLVGDPGRGTFVNVHSIATVAANHLTGIALGLVRCLIRSSESLVNLEKSPSSHLVTSLKTPFQPNAFVPGLPNLVVNPFDKAPDPALLYPVCAFIPNAVV